MASTKRSAQERVDAGVVFTSGYVFDKDLVAMSSCIASVEQQGYELTRMFTYEHGRWGAFDLNGVTVLSICGAERPIRTLYCLGRDGTVHVRRPGKPSQERIAEAGAERGQLGYVPHICEIEGVLYVCGASGQIYRRDPGGWVRFDEGVLHRTRGEGLNLYCMDGTSASDIYAVGQRGLVCHYDGRSWEKGQCPTDSDLNWVDCVSSKEVYVCGNHGFFARGRHGEWETFSLPGGKEEDLWSVETFKGKVYLAGDSGLYVFDGKKVEAVDAGFSLDGHRLHAREDVLWSFGNDRLAFFDGKKWTRVKHPDNPQ